MSTAVIYGETLLLEYEYGARPTDAAGRVSVRKFRFYEGVINLGSNSRKYQGAIGDKKKEEATGKSTSREDMQAMWQHLSLGVGGPPSATSRERP